MDTPRTTRRLLPLFLIAAGLSFAGLGVLSCQSLGRRPLNLILISVDTLRSDHLGFAGHPRPVSPILDRLAAEGRVFTEAWSQSGWTLPSMATLLTGRYPMQHGATDFHWSLNPNLPTLAEILQGQGYDTRGFVSHVLLTSLYGMDQGFSHFDASVLERGNPHEISSSKELSDLCLQNVVDLKEPYFLWLHYFDPHFEYLSHEPWASFGDSEIDRYAQEIAFTDAQIGRVLEFLEARKLLNRTVVVFTSDHGEEFGEHTGKYHDTCYNEVLRVPLVIRAPGLAPGTDAQPAEQIDLLPTVLNLLQVPALEEYPGKDLLGPESAAGPVFFERDRPPGFRQRGVIDGKWKLIRIDESDTLAIPPQSRGTYTPVTNVFPGTFLYDLQADPEESESRLAAFPEIGASLLSKLEQHFAGQMAPTGRVDISPEMRERLRSLGYIR